MAISMFGLHSEDNRPLPAGDYPSPRAYAMVGVSGFNHPRKATGEAPQACRMRQPKLRRGRDQP